MMQEPLRLRPRKPSGGVSGTDPFCLVAKHRASDLTEVWTVLAEPAGTNNVFVAEAWGGLSYVPGSAPGEGRLVTAGWFFGAGARGAASFVEVYEGLEDAEPTRVAAAVIGSPGLEADWMLDNVVE